MLQEFNLRVEAVTVDGDVVGHDRSWWGRIRVPDLQEPNYLARCICIIEYRDPANCEREGLRHGS